MQKNHPIRSMDDVWNDISNHHHHRSSSFQDFFAPISPDRTTPGSGGGTPTRIHFPPPPLTTTTILTLNNPGYWKPTAARRLPTPPPSSSPSPSLPPSFLITQSSSDIHSEKFKRLMKNRESAARSRARKQARCDDLEFEVRRLSKENAKLKKILKEMCLTATTKPLKRSTLRRTLTAPF